MMKIVRLFAAPLAFAFVLASCRAKPLSAASATLAPAMAPTLAPIGNLVAFVSTIASNREPKEYPVGVAVDKLGNVYEVDLKNSRILKFDANGSFVTEWGTPGTGDGQFSMLGGQDLEIDVDAQGNVYVVDSGHRVQKFDPTGKFLTGWGSKGDGDGQFGNGMSIAVSQQGDVYVADSNHHIQKFDNSGKFLLKWGGTGTGDIEFFDASLAVDKKTGNVFVSEFASGRIQQFDGAGKPLTKFFIGSVQDKVASPSDIAVDSHANIYIADVNNDRILKLDQKGALLGVWGEPGTGEGQFSAPARLAVDGQDDIYVADSENGRIQKFAPN